MDIAKLKYAFLCGVTAAAIFTVGCEKNPTGMQDGYTPITSDMRNNPFNCSHYSIESVTNECDGDFVLNIKLPDDYNPAAGAGASISVSFVGSRKGHGGYASTTIVLQHNGKYYVLIPWDYDDAENFKIEYYPKIPVPGSGGEVVLGEGEAWITGDTAGFIFRQDGSYMYVYKQNSVWEEGFNSSSFNQTYSTDDGIMTMEYPFMGTLTFGYSVNGGTLTILDSPWRYGGNDVYTKTGGINIGGE